MKQIAIAVVLSVGLLAAGCQNKVEQCNSLIDVINTGAEALEKAGPTDVDNPDQAADQINSGIRTIDSTVPQLEQLELKDDELKGYADEYKTMMTDTKTHFSKLAGILRTIDAFEKKVAAAREEMEQAQENLSEACSDPDNGDACQELGQVASKMPRDPSESEKVAKWTSQMNEVEIGNADIEAARDELVAAMGSISSAATKGAEHEQEMNRIAEKIDETTSREGPLIDSMNTYCQS